MSVWLGRTAASSDLSQRSRPWALRLLGYSQRRHHDVNVGMAGSDENPKLPQMASRAISRP